MKLALDLLKGIAAFWVCSFGLAALLLVLFAPVIALFVLAIRWVWLS